MSAMNDKRGFEIGPHARVTVLRRHGGYAVAVVLDEGPFSHEQAEAKAAELRRHASGKLTKCEAAELLGITSKGVDYLRSQGILESVREGKRVVVTSESVHAELARRNG